MESQAESPLLLMIFVFCAAQILQTRSIVSLILSQMPNPS